MPRAYHFHLESRQHRSLVATFSALPSGLVSFASCCYPLLAASWVMICDDDKNRKPHDYAIHVTIIPKISLLLSGDSEFTIPGLSNELYYSGLNLVLSETNQPSWTRQRCLQ